MEIGSIWRNKQSGELVLVLFVSDANVSYQTEHKTINVSRKLVFLQDFEEVVMNKPIVDVDVSFDDFNFHSYDDDDDICVSDKKAPYEHGIAIPKDRLVAFRDALNKIIEAGIARQTAIKRQGVDHD